MQNYSKHIDFILIEDNPDDAELFIRALKKVENTDHFLILEDGEQALEFLFNKGKYVSANGNKKLKAIFLDLKLPKLNGLEVLKIIKNDKILQKIPVIILTSSKQDIDINAAYNLGVNSYIVKPLDYDSYIKTIAIAGKYWLKMNEII